MGQVARTGRASGTRIVVIQHDLASVVDEYPARVGRQVGVGVEHFANPPVPEIVPGMKEESRACVSAEIGFAEGYRVRDGAPRYERNQRTIPEPKRQEPRAGTLRGGSIMVMGFEPAVVSILNDLRRRALIVLERDLHQPVSMVPFIDSDMRVVGVKLAARHSR